MARIVVASFVLAIAGLRTAVGGQPWTDDASKAGWQKTLDLATFDISPSDVGVMHALSQYGGDCAVHLIQEPGKSPAMTFKFVRDGEAMVTIEGHAASTFRAEKHLLYFAEYPRDTSGCTIAAYDLRTGKKLWDTPLKAVGSPAHSAYRNRVTMAVSSRPDLDGDDRGVVIIAGQESFGDYMEVLDRTTGERLAHRIFRQGFR